MCLWDQGIHGDNGGVGGGRQDRVLRDDDGGVSGGRGIYEVSEILETTTEAARIQGRQWRLRRHNDGPEELVTTTEASEEEDDPEDSTTTMDVSAEEEEETMRPTKPL